MQFSSRILLFLTSLLQFQQSVLAKVRGVSGVDYPNYSSIPKTSFKCSDKHDAPGFYADFETRCQVFHYCYEHRKESFLCPEGTTFNEAIKSCDYWYSSECDSTENPYEVEARKREKTMYNDAPLVPVKVQSNHIFEKMAALYEPREYTENSAYDDRVVAGTGENSKNVNGNENENYEADSFYTDSLRTQGMFSSELNESSQTGEDILDFVKYEYDSEDGDDVDIIFYDSSVKAYPHKNDNREIDMSNIEFPSETETKRYPYEGPIDKEKEMHQRYNFGKQTELPTTGYPQMVDGINMADLVSSETWLSKRLSDTFDAPKKKRFRRKPTYVVLQTTQELDGLTAESTGYGTENNQPNENLPLHKTNVLPPLHIASPISNAMKAENKLEEDFAQLPVRKLRQNRKTFELFTNVSGETTELIKEYQPINDAYVEEVTVNHSSNIESAILDVAETENKSQDDIKKSRRNRKTFGIFFDEPVKDNVTTIEMDKEYQATEDNTNMHDSVALSSALDNVNAENKPEGAKIPAKRPSRNRKTFGTFIDESNKVKIEKESVQHQEDSIMIANITSPSIEAEAESIFVSEHGTDILTADTVEISQPLSTQATKLITILKPNSNTMLEISETNEKDDVEENFFDTKDSHFNFHKLRNVNIDDMTNKHMYGTEPEESFGHGMQIIPHNTDSGIEIGKYSEQDLNLNVKYTGDSEHERNSDNTKNINSEDEDLDYLEPNIDSDDDINTNSGILDIILSNHKPNSDDTVYMESEAGSLAYSEQEINPNEMVTHIINDNSHGIYNEILSSGEQYDQYDNQNIYKTTDNTFSSTFTNNMLPQQNTPGSNENNYIIVTTLSPITYVHHSSAVNVLGADNDKPILVNENSAFEDEQMSVAQYEPIYHANNINEIDSEHEEKEFLQEEIYLDSDPDISSLSDEKEKNSFRDNQNYDFDLKSSYESLENLFGTETTSQRDAYSDYAENIILNNSEESSDSYIKENFPSQEATAFELSTPLKHIAGISNYLNSSRESLESFVTLGETQTYKDKSEPFIKTLTSFENSNDEYTENVPLTKISEEPFESSTFMEDLNDTHFDENSLFMNISKDSFGNYSFQEAILSEIKLPGDVEDHDKLINHSVKNESGTLEESERDQFEANQKNNQKVAVPQFGFVEKPQLEEEKSIDSMFHSSSMPLPANIFEQGLYKQSLRQEENVPINRDKRYPVTFYKELDDSSEKVKTGNLLTHISDNKKYRSLNFDFPFAEANSENVEDISTKYHEPSIFSLLGPSHTIKRLFSTNFPEFKSDSGAKILKPIKLKKLIAFGKNLLALKRAKLNDFKVLFDLFLK